MVGRVLDEQLDVVRRTGDVPVRAEQCCVHGERIGASLASTPFSALENVLVAIQIILDVMARDCCDEVDWNWFLTVGCDADCVGDGLLERRRWCDWHEEAVSPSHIDHLRGRCQPARCSSARQRHTTAGRSPGQTAVYALD